MAHVKSGGSTKLGRDSESKRLGVKRYAGELVGPGMILIRQRGTKYTAGRGVRRGGDNTLYALREGTVRFTGRSKPKFDGTRRKIQVVEIS